MVWSVLQSQEEEAKKYARDKARELNKARLEAAKKGIRSTPVLGGYSSQSAKFEPTAVGIADTINDFKPSFSTPST